MSFFLKGKPRKAPKRKFDKKVKTSGKVSKHTVPDADEENDNESIDSDLEFNDAPDRSESEGEFETAQEKKVRLAKKYLEEIAREEQDRNETEELDEAAVSRRLKEDYLEQQGRLFKSVADSCSVPLPEEVAVLRCKENRLSITCVCVTGDGRWLYSGSKCAAIVQWSLPDRKKLRSVCYRKGSGGSAQFECHRTPVAALAVTSDGRFLASCERSRDIQVWAAPDLRHLHTFRGHRGLVTDLAFRRDAHQLFSASEDRSVKVWSLDEMAYSETLFGHQAPVTALDALSRERAVSAGGRDCTLRVWKVAEESQLVFNGPDGASIDGVKLLDDEHFASCADDGSLSVWSGGRKKALCTVPAAHGVWPDGRARGVSALAALRGADLLASGASDGAVRVWRVGGGRRGLTPLLELPVPGSVNSLQFSPDGRSLVAGVGQEHKLARWWKIDGAKNAIYIIPIRKS